MTFTEDDRLALGLLVKAPYVASQITRLGGHTSICVTVSFDLRSTWPNGILENSRYAKFLIDSDGTVEHFSGSLPKFRKCKVVDVEAVAAKINKWIANNQEVTA